MLKLIRQKGHMRKILWFIASLIVLSFGLLGQNYAVQNAKQAKYAGKIFGHKISLENFQYNFAQTQMQAMIQYGADFNRIRNLLNLHSQTWDRIILLYEANRRHIRVKDADVVKAIEAYKIFQRNGAFDKGLYDQVLRYGFRIKSRDFEEGMRDTLKFIQLFEQETKSVTIPEQETFNEYRLKNEKAQVSYGLIPWTRYAKDVVFDEAKAKEYFLSHQEEFLQPPQIKVAFVRFDFPQKKATDTATPEAKKTEPAAQPEKSPEPPAVSDEDKNATFEQARQVMEDLNVNPDLGTVAKQRNLTVQTTDFFSTENPDLKNGWPFPLIQELFMTPALRFIGPVETKDGFQILVVKEKKEARAPTYEEAKENVKESWVRNAALEIAQKKAKAYQPTILAGLKEKKDAFNQLVKTNGLELDQTPLFVRGQYLPKIGLSREFQLAAFALKEDNRLSAPVPTEKGYAILYLDTFVPVDQKEYEKIHDQFAFALLRERKNEVFNEFLTRLRLKANLDDKLAQALPAENF